MVTIPDDGVQTTFRDRHYVFPGINMAEDFYLPDYSDRVPGTGNAPDASPDGNAPGTESVPGGSPAGSLPADYRRTLYWNPNAVCDEQGRFTATFFNNGKDTRIRMTAAAVTADGQLLHSK